MTAPKPGCVSLRKWLLLNLGRDALAPLTGTDSKALSAAAHIIELYAYSESEAPLVAFREVVMCMQPTTRELAFHAIAHVMDWDDRARLWMLAGLPAFRFARRCAGEDHGTYVDGAAATAEAREV